MPHPIEVLVVEDSVNDAELLMKQLQRDGFDLNWQRVDKEHDYLVKLRPDLDLIISDFTMPHFNGIQALELMKSRGYEIPFIMVSGTMGEERAVEALKLGATDYLMKGRTGRLGSAVRQALEQSRLRRGVKRAEEAVIEGERKFRALFDAAQDAIYMLHDGVFVDCNTKGQFMYGRSWDQIVGHTPDEFAPPQQPDGRNSREKAFEIVMKAMQGVPQQFEWMINHADGSPVYSEISLNRIEMGGSVYLMAIARDVTERRLWEDKIAEQAALLDNARDAIAVRDLDGSIKFWNKGAERLYGWTSDEVIGRNISQLIYPEPAMFDEANQLVVKNGEWAGEVVHLTKDRREMTVEVRWTLLRDKVGRPRSVLAINTDITEKKMVEAQLMRAQQIENIGILADGIAHELNNTLTPILTSVEILKLQESEPKVRRILETIEISSRRGADIVRQVLSFARGLKGGRIEIQPGRLLKDVENFITDTFPKNILLKVSSPQETGLLLGDPAQLQQMLFNLSLNACDAMPDGGDLAIGVENKTFDETEAARHIDAKAGPYIIFSVRDTGVGIPATILDKIFEPFFTTKEVGKGTGLGLSTVMAIVKAHEGFVDVESQPGRGTCFKIYLPALQIPVEKKDSHPTMASLPRGNGETILVVDDEPSILAVTSDTLEAFGYEILNAHDGAEALSVYEKNRNEISLVLTDMTMPVMDGATAIHHLLKINPDLKIIASSGFKAGDGVNKDYDPGGRHFLAKPYTAEALLKAVRRRLDEALPSDEVGSLTG